MYNLKNIYRYIFLIKNRTTNFEIHLSLRLHEGLQATGDAFSTKKRISSTSKHEIFSLFFNFWGCFLLSWIQIQLTKTNADPCRSGSATPEDPQQNVPVMETLGLVLPVGLVFPAIRTQGLHRLQDVCLCVAVRRIIRLPKASLFTTLS